MCHKVIAGLRELGATEVQPRLKTKVKRLLKAFYMSQAS